VSKAYCFQQPGAFLCKIWLNGWLTKCRIELCLEVQHIDLLTWQYLKLLSKQIQNRMVLYGLCSSYHTHYIHGYSFRWLKQRVKIYLYGMYAVIQVPFTGGWDVQEGCMCNTALIWGCCVLSAKTTCLSKVLCYSAKLPGVRKVRLFNITGSKQVQRFFFVNLTMIHKKSKIGNYRKLHWHAWCWMQHVYCNLLPMYIWYMVNLITNATASCLWLIT